MPQFGPGELKVAVAPISNPTGKGFSYSAELYLGVTKVASSGVVSFYLAAGETRNISFPVTMPSAEGTYPVYIDVFVGDQLIGAYKATEDVEIIPLVLFAYVGAIDRHWLSTRYDYFTVDVQNVGSVPRTCTLEFWTDHKKRSVGYRYTGWELVATVGHTLQPGEVKTFGDESCRCYVTGKDSWVRWYVEFRGPPGVIASAGKHWE